jgi:hypothetical protein
MLHHQECREGLELKLELQEALGEALGGNARNARELEFKEDLQQLDLKDTVMDSY